jgi:hypothetical protein
MFGEEQYLPSDLHNDFSVAKDMVDEASVVVEELSSPLLRISPTVSEPSETRSSSSSSEFNTPTATSPSVSSSRTATVDSVCQGKIEVCILEFGQCFIC